MRKLAIACLAFSCAIFASNYFISHSLLPWLAGLFLVGALYCIIRPAKFLRPVIIAFVFLALGFLFFWSNAKITALKAESLSGELYSIEARLLSYPAVYDDYCRGDVLIVSDNLPRFKAVLYDNSMLIAEAKPGDLLNFQGKLSSAGIKYGEKYDYYFAKDIYLTINTKSDVLVKDVVFNLRTLPQRINHGLTNHVEAVFPQDTSPFIKSLLLGDKTDLYEIPGQYGSLSRAGLAHIVAVSGMHIAYLIGLLQLMLGKSRKSSIIAIIIVWVFVLVSGASPSSLRAALMQSIFLMAPIFRRENDTLTTISFALALILVINPYAATSVSLQLSFAAMSGILAFSSKFTNALNTVIPRKLKFISMSAATSAAAMIFTVPLVAVHFGVVNTLSIVSNVLALWAVSICFCGAYAVCLFALLFPALAVFPAQFISLLVKYILLVAKLISDIPFSTIYMASWLNVLWLVFSYVVFVVFAVSSLKAFFKLAVPIALSALMLFGASSAARLSYEKHDAVYTVLDVGQGQSIAFISGDKTVLLDCGSINTLDNAGEVAAAYLHCAGRQYIDVLILSHLHSDHANGVEDLMELCWVGKIIMPYTDAGEDSILPEILDSAERYNVTVEYVRDDTRLEIGDLEFDIIAPLDVGGINERALIVKATCDEYDMLVMADVSSSVERRLAKEYDFSQLDVLVVGHHGSRYSSCGDFLEAVGADTAIISTGYNSFGHPTHEVLARLNAYGYNILRTDLNGNIEIRLD